MNGFPSKRPVPDTTHSGSRPHRRQSVREAEIADGGRGSAGAINHPGSAIDHGSNPKRPSIVRGVDTRIGVAGAPKADTPAGDSGGGSPSPAQNRHHPPSNAAAQADVARAARIVLAAAARMLLLSCFISAPILLLWVDVQWLRNAVGEFSATEFSQLVLLAITVLGFVHLARRSQDDRRFAVLAAGLFACMLIREIDALLDLLLDGLWQGLVTLVSVTCLIYSLFDWRSTLRGMARLVVSRAGVVMIIGLAILLAYSRLLGMGLLWQGLLGDGYLRLFKNAIEESTELLGYVIILIASLRYVSARLRHLDRRGRIRARMPVIPRRVDGSRPA
jgi:hypothetical protein